MQRAVVYSLVALIVGILVGATVMWVVAPKAPGIPAEEYEKLKSEYEKLKAQPEKFSKEWIAERLKEEGKLVIWFPAGANMRQYFMDKVIPAYKKWVKENYGVDIEVDFLPAAGGTDQIYQKFKAYVEAGKLGTKSFEIDIAKVGPDSFTYDMVEKGWLLPILPDYAPVVPNALKANQPGLFAFSRGGRVYAIPLYRPTISIFYNKEFVKTPPTTLDELKEWIKANPKKFSYVDPRTGYTSSGAAFLVAVMHAYGNINDPATWSAGWKWLKEIEPYCAEHPRSDELLLEGLRRGDLWMIAFWNDWGMFAIETLKLDFVGYFMPKEGMPVRSTPLAIPVDAAHPIAALTFIDYMLSDEAQLDFALTMHQIPGSDNPALWERIPPGAFGYTLDYIKARTFPAYTDWTNINNIDRMVKEWEKQVLGG